MAGPSRRLRRLRDQLRVGSSRSSGVSQDKRDYNRSLARSKYAEPDPSDVVPLAVDSTVTPLPQELERVRDAMHAAADAQVQDYRAATRLQDLLHVVEPKPQLTVDECAPATPEEACDFFLREGFVCVRDLFPPETLRRLQAAWLHAQQPARDLWEEARLVAGNFSGEDFTPGAKFAG